MEEVSHFTQADRNLIVKLETMVGRAVSDIADLMKKVENQGLVYAQKAELDAVERRLDEVDKRTADVAVLRMIAYGLVGLILTSVVGFAITLLFKR